MTFGIISNSLTAAITRYITFEIGTGNKKKLSNIFSTSVNVQIIMGIIVALFIESLGMWFLQAKMDIAPERMVAAQCVLHFSLITFIVSLVSIPYNATIIAHEHMNAYAVVSILDAILKLAVCYPLYWGKIDSLILYSILMAIESIFIRIIYGIYCKKYFAECKYHFVLDKKLLKELFSFAGWNFIGASSSILRDQGVNVLLNIFWGATVNAAKGVANQVNVAVIAFSNNVITAINPQITKNYATGNMDYVFQLVFKGARLSFYLMLFITFPLLFETDIILHLWLTKVPDYTTIFVRLVLVFVLVDNISNTMITLQLATGNIKKYQIIVGGCQLLNFPLSYAVLVMGFEPYVTVVIAIIISFLCLLLRFLLLKQMIGFPVVRYLREVVANIFVVAIAAAFFPTIIFISIPPSFVRLVASVITCVFCISLSVYFLGLTMGERQFITNKIRSVFKYERKD